MLDFSGKKPGKGRPIFSLNPADQARARMQSRVGGRRILHLMFLAAVMLVSGYLLYGYMDSLRNATVAVQPLKREVRLEAMAKPALDSAGEMPDAAAIAAQAPGIAEMIANHSFPLWSGQPDANAIAWIDQAMAKDAEKPPLPQRLTTQDLMLGHVPMGTAVLVSGLLEDSRAAPIPGSERMYQRLLVSIDKDQYIELLAPTSAAELIVGTEVQAVGRYLGPASLAQAEMANAPGAPVLNNPASAAITATTQIIQTNQVQLPFIAARMVFHPLATNTPVENPYAATGDFRLPPDIYDNVDDDLLLLETRPYYYTLGQVRLDLNEQTTLANAPNGNDTAFDIHQNPRDFRGKPFTIHGRVFHAWEDESVAKDKPFGVDRVVRVILWNEDFGKWVQNVGGKEVESRKLVLRAFEMAVITDQPLPHPGDEIRASGRFLRLRAMEVQKADARASAYGLSRQSDRSFSFLFVTAPWTVIPPIPTSSNMVWVNWSLVTFVVILACVLLIRARTDYRKESTVEDSVRRLRVSRQQLKNTEKPADVPEVPPTI